VAGAVNRRPVSRSSYRRLDPTAGKYFISSRSCCRCRALDDVRTAGGLDWRELPDAPALRRRPGWGTIGIGVRGRTGAANSGRGCSTRPGRRTRSRSTIVLAAVITVLCCLALPDRSRVNIDDAAVYSRG